MTTTPLNMEAIRQANQNSISTDTFYEIISSLSGENGADSEINSVALRGRYGDVKVVVTKAEESDVRDIHMIYTPDDPEEGYEAVCVTIPDSPIPEMSPEPYKYYRSRFHLAFTGMVAFAGTENSVKISDAGQVIEYWIQAMKPRVAKGNEIGYVVDSIEDIRAMLHNGELTADVVQVNGERWL